MVVDESTMHGTAVLDEVMDYPVTFHGECTKQDMMVLTEFSSNTNNQKSTFRKTLKFNLFGNNTVYGGVYVNRLTVSLNDPTIFVKPASANDNVMLQVKYYPPLNITLVVSL